MQDMHITKSQCPCASMSLDASTPTHIRLNEASLCHHHHRLIRRPPSRNSFQGISTTLLNLNHYKTDPHDELDQQQNIFKQLRHGMDGLKQAKTLKTEDIIELTKSNKACNNFPTQPIPCVGTVCGAGMDLFGQPVQCTVACLLHRRHWFHVNCYNVSDIKSVQSDWVTQTVRRQLNAASLPETMQKIPTCNLLFQQAFGSWCLTSLTWPGHPIEPLPFAWTNMSTMSPGWIWSITESLCNHADP